MSSAEASSSAPKEKGISLPALRIGSTDGPGGDGTTKPQTPDPEKQPGASPGKLPPHIEPEPLPRTRQRFLTPPEWAIIAHGIGGIRDDVEDHTPIHPTCWYWPPKGLPEGLYKDVISYRSKFYLFFHVLNTVRWIGMVLQLFIGATLTALGSTTPQHGTVITVLAAANTVQTGLLALMNNSGLPDRYRSDAEEFLEVEDYLRAVLDTGLVPADLTLDEALAECFIKFREAKQTVSANIPASYTPSSVLQSGLRMSAQSQPKGSRPPPPALPSVPAQNEPPVSPRAKSRRTTHED